MGELTARAPESEFATDRLPPSLAPETRDAPNPPFDVRTLETDVTVIPMRGVR